MWYSKPIQTVLQDMKTSPDGLTSAEAASRLQAYGRNELAKRKRKHPIKRFLGAFADKMTLVLFSAAGISFVSDRMSGEWSIDPFVILAIVLLNAVISLVQESRAEHALEALNRIASPESTVLRDGREVHIPSAEVVPGDIVVLYKGQIIPCDGRLLESNALQTDESALTGESGGIAKDANTLFPPESHTGDITNSCLF